MDNKQGTLSLTITIHSKDELTIGQQIMREARKLSPPPSQVSINILDGIILPKIQICIHYTLVGESIDARVMKKWQLISDTLNPFLKSWLIRLDKLYRWKPRLPQSDYISQNPDYPVSKKA